MKKTLITILIILILVGAGYFAYSKGLINLDFLKKGSNPALVAEDIKITGNSILKEEQKIDPRYIGQYNQVKGQERFILKSDGAFFMDYESGIRGKFFINDSKIKFVYDDGYPDTVLNISTLNMKELTGEDYWQIDMSGEFGEPTNWGHYQFYRGGPSSCGYLAWDLIESSSFSRPGDLFMLNAKTSRLVYEKYTRIENNTLFINFVLDNSYLNMNLRLKNQPEVPVVETPIHLTFDMDKEIFTDITNPNQPQNLDFDKEIIDELKIACKK